MFDDEGNRLAAEDYAREREDELYAKRQHKQDIFLHKLSMSDVVHEHRYPGHYRWHDISCSCRTCGENYTLHNPDTCLDFLSMHRGHDTWIEYMGKQRS